MDEEITAMDEKHIGKSDRDLLIQVVNDMGWVKKFMVDHLAHHRKLFFAGLGIILSLLMAMGLYIFTQ